MVSTNNAPHGGQKIIIENGVLQVPHNPVIPFVEGDGTGRDIWRASKRVLDAAVEKAYQGEREIAWKEVFAGEKAFNKFGSWLPEETIDVFQEYRKNSFINSLITPHSEQSTGSVKNMIRRLFTILRSLKCFINNP